MSDTPPDRLSLNPRSPWFDGELLRRGVGIRFKGKERVDYQITIESEASKPRTMRVRLRPGESINFADARLQGRRQ